MHDNKWRVLIEEECGEDTNEIINGTIIHIDIAFEESDVWVERDEIEDTLRITSFIASAIGARGTPAVFINDNFNPGYVPKEIIEELLN